MHDFELAAVAKQLAATSNAETRQTGMMLLGEIDRLKEEYRMLTLEYEQLRLEHESLIAVIRKELAPAS